MIRKILLLCLILGGLNSCESQNSINIEGNWALKSNNSSVMYEYQELYINKDTFYLFNENAGIMPAMKYELLPGNKLKLIDFVGEEEVLGKVELKDDTMSFISSRGTIIYVNVTDSVNLQGFLSDKVKENDYWDAFFLRKKRVYQN